MKPLFTCLLVGCLVSPVCAQERNWTLEEFVQKLEEGQPWTREKAEAQLGVKLTKISSTKHTDSWSRFFETEQGRLKPMGAWTQKKGE